MRNIENFRKTVYQIKYPFYKCEKNNGYVHEFEFSNDYFVRCRYCNNILLLEDYDEYIKGYDDRWVM